MKLVCLHEKTEIEPFLRQNVALHLYSLGDLDEFFWPSTQWYGLKQDGDLRALALLYTAISPPVFLALAPPNDLPFLQGLMTKILPLLPRRVYTHLSLGAEEILQTAYRLDSHGVHEKMILVDPERVRAYEHPDVIRLNGTHLGEIAALYEISYPDHAFDPRMLETGQFFGRWSAGQLVSVAGIHVYSPAYRVAAIGNVTTHPEYRNRGMGKSVIAALTHSLLQTVDHIGLNVKRDNLAAIHSYQQLGFSVVASYLEGIATA
ncbi:MAG: hypothetical protein Fur0022_42300 [Anaerolineales bacterium]